MADVMALLAAIEGKQLDEEIADREAQRDRLLQELKLLRKLKKIVAGGGRAPRRGRTVRSSAADGDEATPADDGRPELRNRIWEHLAAEGTGTPGSIAKALGDVHHKTVAAALNHPYFCRENGHYRLARTRE